MDIAPGSMASQGMALNKAQMGSDILQQTIQKSEEAKQQAAQMTQPAKAPQVSNSSNHRVDTYA